MKHTKRTLLSLLLVFAMLATCLVAFSVTSSAELATELPTSWGAELPEGAVAWGSGDMTTASTSLAGSGTEADPYLIANVADFMYFANTAAAAATAENYFKMTGDVYFPVITYTTTSSRYFAPPDFAGHFDGNGHTIWNPRNGYKANAACSSVFGVLTGATIKDLTVKGAFFSQMYIANDSAAAAGLAKEIQAGSILNCHVVDAYLAGSRIGGIVQSASGKVEISGCTVSGTFAPTLSSANSFFGGIVASVYDSWNEKKQTGIRTDVTIMNCVNRMTCTSDKNYTDVGGILGYVKKTGSSTVKISNCNNYGSYNSSTTATDSSSNDGKGIGGIIGRVYKSVSVTLSGCQNHGNLTAPNNVGGMVGLFAPDSSISLLITQCVNKGNITATGQDAGGLVGAFGTLYSSNYLAQDCANYGNIQATDFAGGYIGSVMQGGSPGKSIKNNTVKCVSFANYGSITATNKFAGQIVGFYCRGMNSTSAPNNIVATNSVLAGKVSATACAGSICGGYTTIESAATVVNITLTGCYISCDITKPTGSGVPDRSGAISGGFVANTDTEVAGTFYDTTGLNLKSTDSKFHVTLNGATPAYDYFVTTTTDGVTTTEGKSASLTSLDTAELTNGTALAALNTYASANTLGAWVQGTNAPELESFYQAPTAVQVTLDGATLALRDTMTLKLFVKASSVSEITDLATIVVNDGTKDYTGALDAEAGNYVFEITGLAAKDMGTAKTYTVKYTLSSDTANPITCSEGVEYSPLQYAINMYQKNNGTDANFAALLTSMVRYMDAAGATGAMATFTSATKYTFDDAAAEAAYTEIMKKATEYNIPADTMSLAAELTSGITLLVKPADGKTLTSVKIGTKELTIESAGTNTWRVNGLNPGDLYNELTFTFTTEEGTTEVTYSVARYLNSYVGTASETLAKATALYMDAFITYKTLG